MRLLKLGKFRRPIRTVKNAPPVRDYFLRRLSFLGWQEFAGDFKYRELSKIDSTVQRSCRFAFPSIESFYFFREKILCVFLDISSTADNE